MTWTVLPRYSPCALLLDDRQVDLAGRVVAVAGQRGVGEPLVVAQVEVGLGAVVEDVDLAVLVGAHRAGIDVDVRVELLQPDAQAAVLQQHADRGAGQPLAERADHAAGDEDVLGHRGSSNSSAWDTDDAFTIPRPAFLWGRRSDVNVGRGNSRIEPGSDGADGRRVGAGEDTTGRPERQAKLRRGQRLHRRVGRFRTE